MKHIVALSGGKDSTAMALRLAEIEPREYEFVFTPTGDEPVTMRAHWLRLGELLGKPLKPITCGQSLNSLIQLQRALPNWRMRWCTRMLKIEPFETYVLQNLPCTVYVGIRADEVDREAAVYGDFKIIRDFPLQRWEWGINRVIAYLRQRQVVIPERTDCEKCFFQTLYEWWRLWKDNPTSYAEGEAWESLTGHTLRSEQRDSHPAALKELRKEFEGGYVPKPRKMADRKVMCAVCAR
jgi:hypothetical protein